MRRNGALLIHSGAIGDFVLTLSIVQAMRRAGHAPIRILGQPWYSQIAGPSDGVDAVDCLDASPWHTLFGEQPHQAVIAIESRGAPRLVIDMLGISDAASRAMTSAGVELLIRIDSRPQLDSKDHITQQWADAFRMQGVEWSIEAPRLETAADVATRDGAIIHVGSGGRSKCWPLSNWIDLAKQFRRSGLGVSFLLGPTELESSTTFEWDASLGPFGAIIEAPPFPELKRMISRSAVFLGNDSGITHLAAAMGTPTVAVFGATDPGIWRPMGALVTTSGRLNAWPGVNDVLSAVKITAAKAGRTVLGKNA